MNPIALSTVHNIRDLGGMKTRDGLFLRPGCLIRSARLSDASPQDIDFLRRNNRLRTVIDLRTDQERRERPDRADGLDYRAMPVIEDLQAGITHEQNAAMVTFPDMGLLYRLMMDRESNRAGFRRVLHAIFTYDYSAGAVLWHCTEGKDRCGMTAALVLEALGVSRDDILEDYLITNQTSLQRAQARYEYLLPLRGETFARSVYRAYLADERYLRAAWAAMGENYITETLGIPEAEIQAFRLAVLTA